MLEISKEQVNNLIGRLNDPTRLSQCQKEVEKMLEIKSALLWWADSGKCCSQQVRDSLISEVQILEGAMNSLKGNDISHTSYLLTDYMNLVE